MLREQPPARARPGRSSDRETAARPDDHRALRVWLRLLTCTQLIERQIRNELRTRFGTTLPRFDLMSQLERHPEGLKMNELSRRMMVSGGNVTGITDQLVKEGLVERVPQPSDRRSFRIKLTRAGARAFAAMASEHETWIVGLLSGLSKREHQDLLGLLAKVKQHAMGAVSAGIVE